MDRLTVERSLRTAAQAASVARRLSPGLGFAADVARGRPEGCYRVKATGAALHCRPRVDLQVLREQIARAGYVPPPEVVSALRSRRPVTVLDLGANIGMFTMAAVRLFGEGTLVRAVEPDPTNLPLLERNIADNGLGDRVELHRVAAGAEAGTVRFRSGLHHVSYVAPEGENWPGTIDVPIVDAFELAAGCDLVKMDIEGGEWPILADPRLASLDAVALVLEWHARGALSDRPGDDAVRLLEEAGFTVKPDPHLSHDVGGLWAWRAAR